jgi:hypothetical protein
MFNIFDSIESVDAATQSRLFELAVRSLLCLNLSFDDKFSAILDSELSSDNISFFWIISDCASWNWNVVLLEQ